MKWSKKCRHSKHGKEDLKERRICRIQQVFKDEKLSNDKKNKTKYLVDAITSKKTVVAISGENGSGKTTFIDYVIKGYIGSSEFTKFWVKIWWCVLKFISFFTFGNWKESINNRATKYNFKIYKVNLWRVFKNCENTPCIENENKTKLKEENAETKEKSIVTVKSLLWQSIFINMKISRNSYYYFKKWLNNIEIVNFEHKMLFLHGAIFKISIFTFILFVISISIALVMKDIKIEGKIMISVTPIFISLIIFMYDKHFLKTQDGEKVWDNNLSNDLINMTLSDFTKDKTIFLHFEDLDRLSLDGELINEIIDNISIIYSVKNLNILIEVNEKILDVIKENNETKAKED